MNFIKPKFWDLKKPNLLSKILIIFTFPLVINNFLAKLASVAFLVIISNKSLVAPNVNASVSASLKFSNFLESCSGANFLKSFLPNSKAFITSISPAKTFSIYDNKLFSLPCCF